MVTNTSQPGSFQFSAPTYHVGADDGTATITVTRSGGSAGSASVAYGTSDGTACAGTDYTATSGILAFADGQTSQTFSIPILANLRLGGDQTINLSLTDPTRGVPLGHQSQAILTIVNLNSLVVTIGTDATGNAGLGNGQDGSTIGGSGTAAGNLISGNALAGVRIEEGLASGNLLVGNTIGTKPSGTAALANRDDGVLVDGAPGNTIGATNPSARNLISDNHFAGVQLTGAGASGNLDEGDGLDTDVNDLQPLDTSFDGIFLDEVPDNTLGGTIPTASDLIPGNGSVDLQLYGSGASGNQVLGNFIGTDLGGTHPLGNALDGVFLNSAPGNTVGGTAPGAENLISGNGSAAVPRFGQRAARDVVQGNLIGTNAFGEAQRMGNAFGLFENVAPIGATFGGPEAARNLKVANRRANVTRGNGSNLSTAPGTSTLRAHNTPSKPDMMAPTVTQAATTVAGSFVTAIVLHLRQPIDSARATDLSHYLLRLPGGRFVGPGGSTIPLHSASYDPDAQKVTLNLETPVSTSLFFQLSIRDLTDTDDGHLLLDFGRVATGQPTTRGSQMG